MNQPVEPLSEVQRYTLTFDVVENDSYLELDPDGRWCLFDEAEDAARVAAPSDGLREALLRELDKAIPPMEWPTGLAGRVLAAIEAALATTGQREGETDICPYCGRPEDGVHGDHRVRRPAQPEDTPTGLQMPQCIILHDHEADEGHCVKEFPEDTRTADPGGLRAELHNQVERAMTLSDGGTVARRNMVHTAIDVVLDRALTPEATAPEDGS